MIFEMTPKHFVHLAKRERDNFFESAFTSPPATAVAAKIAAMKLDPERMTMMRDVVDLLLTDVFYTWLLAIDGEAGLGPEQHPYVLKDENGNLLTDCGKIEAEAWEAFHGDSKNGA